MFNLINAQFSFPLPSTSENPTLLPHFRSNRICSKIASQTFHSFVLNQNSNLSSSITPQYHQFLQLTRVEWKTLIFKIKFQFLSNNANSVMSSINRSSRQGMNRKVEVKLKNFRIFFTISRRIRVIYSIHYIWDVTWNWLNLFLFRLILMLSWPLDLRGRRRLRILSLPTKLFW